MKQAKNKPSRVLSRLAWKANNKDKMAKTSSAWRKKNKDKCKTYSLASYAKHKDSYIARAKKRKMAALGAMPTWADKFLIGEAYHLSALRTKVLGFKWHVDHIVPIQSSLVCGLHVHSNLQVIPGADNIRKKNLVWPDMP